MTDDPPQPRSSPGLNRTARWLRNDRARFGLAAALLMLGPFTVLTAVVLITAPGVPGIDAHLAADLHRLVLPRPGLAQALRVIGVISLPWCLRAPALVGALVLWRRGRGRAALWLILTMAAGGVLSVVLKLLIGRDRPPWADPIAVASGYSYPSGHAMNSMVLAACLVALLRPGLNRPPRRWVCGVAGAAVLLIGFDRVALGVHYLTDVLAGWTAGLAVVLLALALADPRPDVVKSEPGSAPLPG
jgi:undecaprenyl-diphosphatase